MKIRAFKDTDTQALTQLLHEAYAELGAMGLNFTAVDQDDATTLARASQGACWVVEAPSGALIATLTLAFVPSAELQAMSAYARMPNTIWLNQLAVSPKYRGKGLARQLFTLALVQAKARGAHYIGLDTALPAEHLIKLYQGWGFCAREIIHWSGKTYDSTVMIKSLSDET